MMAPRGSSWWHCSKLRGSWGEQKQLKQLKQCVMLCHFVSFCVILCHFDLPHMQGLAGLPACPVRTGRHRVRATLRAAATTDKTSGFHQEPATNVYTLCISLHHFASICQSCNMFDCRVICVSIPSSTNWVTFDAAAFRSPTSEVQNNVKGSRTIDYFRMEMSGEPPNLWKRSMPAN